MPVAVIPFTPPAPFALPDSLCSPPFETAVRNALDLLLSAGCAEAAFIAVRKGDGFALVDGATQPPIPDALMEAIDQELPQGAEFLERAVSQASALLLMGEVVRDEASPFPPALRDFFLVGTERQSIGFFYAFPLVDEQGRAFGAIALLRRLASGPLNHDQPAITQAIAQALGGRGAEVNA